jgi:hypothetical protein
VSRAFDQPELHGWNAVPAQHSGSGEISAVDARPTSCACLPEKRRLATATIRSAFEARPSGPRFHGKRSCRRQMIQAMR